MNTFHTSLTTILAIIIYLRSPTFCEHRPTVEMTLTIISRFGSIDSVKPSSTLYEIQMNRRLTTRLKRKAADSSLLWPNATVPFTYGQPEPDKEAIIAGMNHWEKHTCIRFTEVSDSNSAHVVFRDLEGCRSSVGRMDSAGQNISIGDTCTEFGIVVHEIGHALGFYHEIRRPDRDEYVVVNSKNIETEELFNFYKVYWLNSSIPYDLSSVMHYTSMEWSQNGKTTVATKDPMLQGILDVWKSSVSSGLSHRDKYLANKIYGCLQIWLSKCKLENDPCKGEGFLGQSCHCICPPGTSGRYCEHKVGTYYDDLKSQCSQEITYDTVITSPNYPNNYDPGTWCVYIVNGSQCRSPVFTILDFQMGPRDHKDQCYHDFLEIRNDSLYDGFKKCATEVTPGYTVFSKDDTMILYFKGEQGGYRGFKGKVSFVDMIDCCRAIRNNTSFHVLSPQYPSSPKKQFNCTIDLHPTKPSKVKVMNIMHQGEDDSYFLPNVSSQQNLPCGLMLCQLTGCKRGCANLKKETLSVVLPNSGNTHYFSSSKLSDKIAMHLVFQLIPSSCHKIIEISKTNPSGQLLITSEKSKFVQCEWWIKAPTNNHVKFFVGNLRLKNSENNYLAINEAGVQSFPGETSKIFKSSDIIPKFMVSIGAMLIVVIQGDQNTRVNFDYELYNCTDSNEECPFWASIGECNQNPEWMLENCKYSCNLCEFSVECKDYNDDCSFWAENNQCKENEEWMSINCQMSCGHCDSCENRNPLCESWSILGHCQSQAKYMKHFCPRACQFCNASSTPSNATIEMETKHELEDGLGVEIILQKENEKNVKGSDEARIVRKIQSKTVETIESYKRKKYQSYRIIRKEKRLKDVIKSNLKKKIITMVNHFNKDDIKKNSNKSRKLNKLNLKRAKINQKYKHSKTYRSSNQINNTTNNKSNNLPSYAKKFKAPSKKFNNTNSLANNIKKIFKVTKNKTNHINKLVKNDSELNIYLSGNKSFIETKTTPTLNQYLNVKKAEQNLKIKNNNTSLYPEFSNISKKKLSKIKNKLRFHKLVNKNTISETDENSKVIKMNRDKKQQPTGSKKFGTNFFLSKVKHKKGSSQKNSLQFRSVNTQKFVSGENNDKKIQLKINSFKYPHLIRNKVKVFDANNKRYTINRSKRVLAEKNNLLAKLEIDDSKSYLKTNIIDTT